MPMMSGSDKVRCGRQIVQMYPGGKARLDPSIVPELTAFLLTHSDRFQSIVDAMEKIPKIDRGAYHAAVLETANDSLGSIQGVIDSLDDKFSRYSYNSHWQEVADAFGLTEVDLLYRFQFPSDEFNEGSGI